MPEYPATLPQFFIVQGFSERPAAPVVRSQVEAGEPKTRLREDIDIAHIDGRIRMTVAQYEVFRTWYRDDLGHGSLAFDWVHPMTRDAAVCRFRDHYQASVQGIYYVVQVSLAVT